VGVLSRIDPHRPPKAKYTQMPMFAHNSTRVADEREARKGADLNQKRDTSRVQGKVNQREIASEQRELLKHS
jgi:hypothetical protein